VPAEALSQVPQNAILVWFRHAFCLGCATLAVSFGFLFARIAGRSYEAAVGAGALPFEWFLGALLFLACCLNIVHAAHRTAFGVQHAKVRLSTISVMAVLGPPMISANASEVSLVVLRLGLLAGLLSLGVSVYSLRCAEGKSDA
jgi:hypothetical protein